METHLHPISTWDDFYQYYKANKVGAMPTDIRVAQHTREGKARQKSGRAKTLRPDRIKNLLDKYAPGRYVFHAGEPYFTKMD